MCAAVCGMRRVQQVNYRCAQLALGCAINSAGSSIRTSTQFNECANIGYLKVGVFMGVCVSVCVLLGMQKFHRQHTGRATI